MAENLHKRRRKNGLLQNGRGSSVLMDRETADKLFRSNAQRVLPSLCADPNAVYSPKRKITIEDVTPLIRRGLNVAEMAQELHVSKTTIYNRLDEN